MNVLTYSINNGTYFSCKEIYLALGKYNDSYGWWLRKMVIQNPCLKQEADYITIEDSSKFGIPGRKAKHVMLTRQTAIALCIMMRTIIAQKLRETIEKA